MIEAKQKGCKQSIIKEVREINERGRQLFDAGQYHDALTLHKEALAMVEQKRRTKMYRDTNRYIGEVYNTLGDYTTAEFHYFESCLLTTDGVFSHYDNSHYHIFLGDLNLNRGEYDEAFKNYLTALAIREFHKGERSEEVAEVCTIIGEYYHNTGDYEQALQLFETARNIYINNTGTYSAASARYYAVEGSLRRDKGELAESRKLLEKALKIQTSIGEICDLDRAYTLENMALLLREEGKKSEAIEVLKRVIKIYKDHYPSNHHYIAGVYNIWGTILNSEEKIEAAMEMYDKALKMMLTTLYETHFDLADSYTNIGSIYLQNGELSRAMEYFQLAEMIDGSNLYLGHCHKALGCIALIESRFEDAHRELFAAIDIYISQRGDCGTEIIETNCYIEDLRQRISEKLNCEVYIDYDEIIYGVATDDYGIYYSKDFKSIIKVPPTIGRTLVGYCNRNIDTEDSYILCYDSVVIPIPESVTSIRSSAFEYNEGLCEIVAPNITNVESLAFDSCELLRSYKFAADAKIGIEAFNDCYLLE